MKKKQTFSKKKLYEILINICISYTVISIIGATFDVFTMQRTFDYEKFFHLITLLIWTSIAVCVLYTHHLFERLSTLAMIILQYVIALSLVFLSIFIMGFLQDLSPSAYRDAFRSFSIFYVIGAVIYYMEMFYSVKRQNRILDGLKKGNKI